MPPLPPARQPAQQPPPHPLRFSTRHARFLRLLASPTDARPLAHRLSQAAYDALPDRCKLALARVADDASIDPWTQCALVAYYASGYRPFCPSGAWDYTEDARRAIALLNAPEGHLSTFLSLDPATADKNVVARLVALMDKPDLKAGEKVRLEALRLVLQLKGHLRDEKAHSIQATQIVIHTSQEPTTQPQEQTRVIAIDL